MQNIQRVAKLSPAELDANFLSQDKPLILTAVLGEWHSQKSWGIAELRERLADQELRIRGGSRDSWRLLSRTKASEYFDYLQATPTERARHPLAPFSDQNPYAAFNAAEGIQREFRFEELVPPKYRMFAPRFWIGPRGSLTPLHYDASGTTLLAQLLGRKQFTLFPFSQAKHLYPSDIFDYQSVFSGVNLDRPDLGAHPLYRSAERLEVELHAGEILVIPNRMWHEARALDVSVSVTTRIATRLESWHPRMLKWQVKSMLHLCGLYKRTRCLCHIDEIASSDVAAHPALIRFLAQKGLKAHGRDLPELIGWNSSATDDKLAT